MRYRRLGQTDLQVSEIGFGGWGIGGKTEYSYGETDDATSLAALYQARDLGVTLYDTSPAYGRSEELIGKAFNGSSDIVLMTKVGYLNWEGEPNFTPDVMTNSVETSLRRLKSDRIDVLMLHGATPDILESGDVQNTLSLLVKSGKIRYWGVSAKSPDDALQFLKFEGVTAIQLNFNMMDTRALTSGLLDKNVGIIARTPLCFGFLTGKINRETTYPEGDHRLSWPRAQLENWIDGAAELLREVDEEQAALRYCLSFHNISSIIPGAMNLEEVRENVRASDLGPLKEEHIERVAEINRHRNFFVKK